MKLLKWMLGAVVLLAVVYLIGPKAKFGVVDTEPVSFDIPLESLAAYIEDRESSVEDLKPGNGAEIVWADSTHQKTEFAIVYLHGFSASHEEGAPVHRNVAERYGFNLYLSRMFDHGRDTKETFRTLTPEDLVNSAKEEIAIAKLLGEKVILMTCSTGSTVAALLAPEDPAVHSVLMYSPNIDVYDPTSKLLTGRWGKQMLGLVMGDYNQIDYDSTAAVYWNKEYHTNGLIALKYLIEEEMTEENFRKFDKPLYMGYYYEDEEHQDKVVSVERMLDFYDQISTPGHLKVKEAFPDAGRHVFTSRVFSKNTSKVTDRTIAFMDEVLGLIPIDAD